MIKRRRAHLFCVQCYLFKQDFPVSMSTLHTLMSTLIFQLPKSLFFLLFFFPFCLLHIKDNSCFFKKSYILRLFFLMGKGIMVKNWILVQLWCHQTSSMFQNTLRFEKPSRLCSRFYQWSKNLCLLFDFKGFSFFINFYFHSFSFGHKRKCTCKHSIYLYFAMLAFIWNIFIYFSWVIHISTNLFLRGYSHCSGSVWDEVIQNPKSEPDQLWTQDHISANKAEQNSLLMWFCAGCRTRHGISFFTI